MKKAERRLRPPTPQSLANAALAYLSRFAASEAALRRVLENRIRRVALHNDAFSADEAAQQLLRQTIATIIEKHRKTGVLNDAAYAEVKLRSLRRAGRSARAIRHKLGHAGVGRDIVDRALTNAEDAAEAELKAARELARRRRLGPFRADFRSSGADFARRQKDLAVLARAGFPLAIARQALEESGES